MNTKISISLSLLLLTSTVSQAGVSGTVFQDLPDGSTAINYGTQETNDLGVEGIKVTAYSNDTSVSTTTSADGTWSLDTTEQVRVEFSDIPAYLKESPGQSSVQFLNNEEVGNLALHNPSEYVGDAGDIAMTFISNGKTDSGSVALKVLTSDNRPGEDTKPTTVGDIGVDKLGSVWGLAYDNSNNALYTAAVVRRYAAMGEAGTGAIYKIDISDSENPTVSLFTTVSNTGTITANDSRSLADSANTASHDSIFDEVGRIGLGDIDVSEDGKKLYTINLNTNSLVEIELANPSTQTIHAITNPFSTCSDDDVTSWGIGQKNGEVYVGSVCTTDVSEGAYVSKFNGTNFTGVHSIPLDMKGENSAPATYPETADLADNARWGTWIKDYNTLFDSTVATRMSYPAPILSDIVFDENNGMILGFTDRTAMQAGVNNYSPDTTDSTAYKYDASGDIYRVCKVAGTYYNEGSDQCPQRATGAQFLEFFTDEEWDNGAHEEIALGGLAYQQGSSNILTTAFDPVPKNSASDNYDSAGVIWMDTVSGERTAAQKMVGGADERIAYNGKAGGMGDLEYLNTPAPTEIGNRVWADDNGNCIQDANESGIAGVTVSLYESTDCTGAAQTVTTDANGRYLFPVNAGTQYSVCINDIAGQAVLNDKKLTCNTAGTTLHNSDATVDGDDAKIAIPALTAGANDHSFDFGFANTDAVIVPPTDNNRTVTEATDEACDCDSYTEDSTPTLSVWSMMILISLTSFTAFLFRKELTQLDN